MRRFHGTCDPLAMAHWAAFCVSFVEAFRSSDLVARVFDVPLAQGLATMRTAQEAATPAELIQRMAGHLDPASIAFLMEDACPGAAAGLELHAAPASASARLQGSETAGSTPWPRAGPAGAGHEAPSSVPGLGEKKCMVS